MTTPDPALVARCAEHLRQESSPFYNAEEVVRAILAIATPAIRAAALEEARQFLRDLRSRNDYEIGLCADPYRRDALINHSVAYSYAADEIETLKAAKSAGGGG